MNELHKKVIEGYDRLKNLKLVGEELGIPWQSVHWILKKNNINCVGNKEVYGSATDKFACVGENYIAALFGNKVLDMNKIQWQAGYDMEIDGVKVDVKSRKFDVKNKRWAFYIKKQITKSEFFILLAYDKEGKEILFRFLIPNMLLMQTLQTISIPKDPRVGKWWEFAVTEQQLKNSF